MKYLKTSILTFLTFTIGSIFFACSDNDDNIKPITFKDYDETPTSIKLVYSTATETGYTYILEGGDGKYSVKSANPLIAIAEMKSDTELNIKALKIGETTITITDESQNKLTIDITVDYLTHEFIVKKHDITIIGDDLTANEKKAISEKYLAQIPPIKEGGGYKFAFTDYPNTTGKVIIYKEVYGSEGVVTIFDYIEFKIENAPSKWAYSLILNNGEIDEQRFFFLERYYPSARNEMVVTMALVESITAKVQKEYPAAESVYISQVIERPSY